MINKQNKRRICTGFLFALLFTASYAGNYWVFFTDKNGVIFDSHTFFHKKAIERRLKHNLSLIDTSDFPLQQKYVNKVTENAVFLGESRWLNAIKVKTSASNAKEIEKLPFVKEVKKSKMLTKPCDTGKKLSGNKLKLALAQTKMMEGDLFKQRGLSGKGIRIAIFDGGFPHVNTSSHFSHLIRDNKIIAAYNFVKKDTNIFAYNEHGTNVLACLAAKYDSVILGLAPEAEYLLAVTERNREPFSEEENWLMAAEWADRLGADIINSSLGYTKPRYSNDQMNGKISLVARAAEMAARKGILVIVAVGNEGQKRWKTLATPADAKEILAVGSVHPVTENHLSFSSKGPSADGRVKPDVCASGVVLTIGKNGEKVMMGTSFSTPLIAGFSACLMQSKPGLKVSEVIQQVRKASNLYPYFDYIHGFGVPKASRLFSHVVEEKERIIQIEERKDGSYSLSIPTEYLKINKKNQVLYYHLADKNNILVSYGFKTIKLDDNVQIINKPTAKVHFIRVFFKGDYRVIKVD